jgi:hypothetical protein
MREGQNDTCQERNMTIGQRRKNREHTCQKIGIMFPVLVPESITSSAASEALSRVSSALRLFT